jgi:parvulin-like peptidyl-prolyl isomerase
MKNSLIIVAALIAAFFAGCGGSDRVVAEVNGYAIHGKDLESALAQEKKKFDAILIESPGALDELKRQTLDMLIQEAVLLGEAKRLGIRIEDGELSSYLESIFGTPNISKIEDTLEEHGIDADYWLKGQRNKLVISKLVQREVVDTVPVTEKEIDTYYKKNIKDYRQPIQYRASQILVDTPERAEEISKRLKKGEDFAELAREYSVSPDSERGGDIGYFSTKGFPHVFSEICASLKKGEISEVKKTDYGYQIFKLIDRRPPRTQPLDEVRDEIAGIIRHERGQDAFALWFEELRSKAAIKIAEPKTQEVTRDAPTS